MYQPSTYFEIWKDTKTLVVSLCVWAGISKIVFALSKDQVSNLYYGSEYRRQEINDTFIKKIQIVHYKKMEQNAIEIVNAWEQE